MPGMVSSVLLFIVGAVLKFAYSDSVWTWTSGGTRHTLELDTIGMILIVAAIVLFVFSAIWNFMIVAPRDEVEYHDEVEYRDEVVRPVVEEPVVQEPVVEPPVRKAVKRSRKKTI